MRAALFAIFVGFAGLLFKLALYFLAGDYDPASEAGLPWSSPTDQFAAQLNSPLFTAWCVALIVLGAIGLMMFGRFVRPAPRAQNADQRPAPSPALNDRAQTALANVKALEGRFRAMPSTLVAPETRIEFDAITSRHLPDLIAAHGEARASVPAGSTEADALDRDYALSLDRLAGSMDHLLDACEEIGRARMEVQSRFIEARHTDGL